MKGIGAVVIVGLVVWWLTQRQKQAQAAELLPGKTYPTEYGESEYEKLHKVVPITEYIEKELIVFDNLEHSG